MGEDLPLDPNQVQPPQVQAEQVAVPRSDAGGNYYAGGDDTTAQIREGEESYEPDKARAWDMAEAGDVNRTKAAESRNKDTAEKHKNSFSSDSTPESRAKFYDDQADKAEKTAGEIYDEAQSSDFSNDTEKAKRMIKAGRQRRRNLAEPTPREEGAEYDLEAAEAQLGKPRAEALKDAPDYKVSEIFLRYSRVIAENYRKHGDELTPNLKALELVASSVPRNGTNPEYEFGKFATVRFNDKKGGAIDIITGGRNIGSTTEKWHIPMFDGDPENRKHSGPYSDLYPRDFAYYEVTETTRNTEEGFDKVETKKTRSLGDEDIANLNKLFGKVSDYAADERANTLYPGDDGYEEELAEINYGRDSGL